MDDLSWRSFNWVSDVILDYIAFALIRSLIALENSSQPLNHSSTKLKSVTLVLFICVPASF